MANYDVSTDTIISNNSTFATSGFAESSFGGASNLTLYSNNLSLDSTQLSGFYYSGDVLESQVLVDSESVKASFFVSTDIVIYNDSGFAGSTFAGASFGGLNDLPRSTNTLTLTESESVQAAFISSINETQTLADSIIGGFYLVVLRDESTALSTSENVIAGFVGDINEIQELTDIQNVLAAFIALQNESFILLDYQIQRGWIKINDNQTVQWVSANNTQSSNWTQVDDTQIPNWNNINNSQ